MQHTHSSIVLLEIVVLQPRLCTCSSHTSLAPGPTHVATHPLDGSLLTCSRLARFCCCSAGSSRSETREEMVERVTREEAALRRHQPPLLLHPPNATLSPGSIPTMAALLAGGANDDGSAKILV